MYTYRTNKIKMNKIINGTVGTNELGNTKPTRIRSRAYCLTLNNYLEEEYEQLKSWAQKNCEAWIIGKEIGESGTPHLQGYFNFKNPTDLNTIKSLNNKLHIEKAKGKKEQNFKYCSKDKKYEQENMISKQDTIKERILNKYNNVKWKDWQQSVLEQLNKKPDNRTINWIYDPIGNNGKTFLRKYLALTRNCIICDGKKDNVLNQLKIKCIDENQEITMIIMDVPRHNKEYINYGLLEQLKDGHVYSGKYEGGEIWIDDIHVVVFSNEEPDKSKFSEDRWNIIQV